MSWTLLPQLPSALADSGWRGLLPTAAGSWLHLLEPSFEVQPVSPCGPPKAEGWDSCITPKPVVSLSMAGTTDRMTQGSLSLFLEKTEFSTQVIMVLKALGFCSGGSPGLPAEHPCGLGLPSVYSAERHSHCKPGDRHDHPHFTDGETEAG